MERRVGTGRNVQWRQSADIGLAGRIVAGYCRHLHPSGQVVARYRRIPAPLSDSRRGIADRRQWHRERPGTGDGHLQSDYRLANQ